MKQCHKCKLHKTLDQFSKNKSRKDGHQAYCIVCMNKIAIELYHRNKEKYFVRAKERDAKLDSLINGYKNKPCADCGMSFPPFVMDFDHLGDKNHNICTMRRRRMAFHKIEAEIKKCEVVCSNCHRIRSNRRNPARYTKGESK